MLGTCIWKGMGQSQLGLPGFGNGQQQFTSQLWTGHLGMPQPQQRGREGRKGQWCWQEIHDSPRGEKGKKKKNHPKKPRKEDFAKWHHFILIRQRLKGWGEVWKQRHLGVRQKGGRSGQRLRKTTTRDPDGNTPAGRCKEAGQGGWQEWRPHRGHVLPLSWPAVSQKRSNGPGRTDNADRDLTKKMSCPQRNRGICRSRRQKVKELT